ncbi:MAG TPA: SNF2-related protein [Acidimicrobiales bacterium]|nr:SNF2-related protein [Acidimicrobiales bacterium]
MAQVTGTNPLARIASSSKGTTGTIEDYQLDPVVRALGMPRANLLIADDVGLGKTIEAGLVAQELLLRHRARTVLVVCPAGLVVKWQEEMRDRFGLEFRIVNTDAVRQLRRDGPGGSRHRTTSLRSPTWRPSSPSSPSLVRSPGRRAGTSG